MVRRGASAKELLARAQARGYEPGLHREEDSTRDSTKYVKKTLKDQNWALGRYKKWVEAVARDPEKQRNDGTIDVYHATAVPSLVQDAPPPNLATIKDFLRFHIAISQGRIDEEGRITADSVNTFAEWFFAGWARVTGNTVDEDDRKAVYD
ncbi:hypothetical protein MMC24_002442, partial [Lignoscripta atroalba]|nr:hypothetical protein [Lignoscripta atroalba]